MTHKLIILLFLFLLASCASQTPVDAEQTDGLSQVTATGTIRHIELEGGFWGIVGEDGTNYDPTNLSDNFKEDGLKVNFTARRLKDVGSMHMWGQIVEIDTMSRAD